MTQTASQSGRRSGPHESSASEASGHLRQAIVAFGSNLAPEGRSCAEVVTEAMARVAERLAEGPARASALYRSPAYPPGNGADFVNSVMAFLTPHTPEDILAALHEIEAGWGRARKTRWGPRPIDLDLIAVEAELRPDVATLSCWIDLPPERQAQDWPEHLLLPHPRLQDRAFVLVPMLEVTPDWRHPLTGRSAAQMAAALPPGSAAGLVRIAPQA